MIKRSWLKITMLLLALCAAAGLGLYVLMGNTQARLKMFVDNVNDAGVLGAGHIEPVAYENRFFSARNVYDVFVTHITANRIKPVKTFRVTINSHWLETLLSGRLQTRIELTEPAKKRLSRLTGIATGAIPDAGAITTVDAERIVADIRLPDINTRLQNGRSYHLAGTHIHFNSQPTFENLHWRIRTEVFEDASPRLTVRADNAALSMTGDIAPGGFVIGTGQATVDAWLVKLSNAQQIQARDLNTEWTTALDEGRLHSDLALTMQDVEFFGENFGELALSGAVKDLDFESLVYIEKQRSKLLKQGQTPRRLGGVMFNLLQVKFREFFQYSPSLTMDNVTLTSNGDRLFGRLELGIENTGKPVDNIFALFQALTAEGELTVSKNYLLRLHAAVIRSRLGEHMILESEQLNKMADDANQAFMRSWLDKNIVVRKNDNYHINASMHGARLILNGRPIKMSLPDLGWPGP